MEDEQMPHRSDTDKIIRELRQIATNKASFAKLADRLGGKWTPQLGRQKVEELDRDDDVAVFVVHGGAQYFGVERCGDPGLYKEVRRGITRRWAREMSIPRAEVEPTFRL